MEMLYRGSKRILSLLLTFSMVFGSLSPTAFTAYAAEIDEDVEIVSDTGGDVGSEEGVIEEIQEDEEEDESDAEEAGGSAQEDSGGQAQEPDGEVITEDSSDAGAEQVEEPAQEDAAPAQEAADDDTVTEEIQEEEVDAEAAQQDAADADDNTIPEETEGTSEDVSVSMPAFSQSKTVDGVKVKVEAPAGVFPADATLSVEKVELPATAEEAVEEKRDEDAAVVTSYTFDIKVLDKDNKEIQPPEGVEVKVSFTLDEVADKDLNVDVYHIEETVDGEHEAEKLDTTEKGRTVTAVTDGFSLYQVEITTGADNVNPYSLPVGQEIGIVEILNYLNIKSTKLYKVTCDDSNVEVDSNNENTEHKFDTFNPKIKIKSEFTNTVTVKVTYYTGGASPYTDDIKPAYVYLKCVPSHTHNWNSSSTEDTLTVECVNAGCDVPTGTDLTYKLDAADADYNGQAHYATVQRPASSLPGITVGTVEYRKVGGGAVSDPIDAGKYEASVQITTGNSTVTLTKAFEIKPVEADSIQWGDLNPAYDGTDKTPSAIAISGGQSVGNVTVSVTGNSTALTDGKAINAGTYKVSATGIENGNYILPNSVSDEDLTVKPLKLEDEGYTIDVVCTPTDAVYTGSKNPPKGISVKATKGSKSFNLEASDYDLTWSPADLKKVGAYSVKLTFKGNYAGNVEVSNVYEIKKAQADAAQYGVSLEDWIYKDGQQHVPEVTKDGNPITSAYTISYSYKQKNADDDAYSPAQPQKAGEYMIRALISSKNEEPVTVTSTFKVEKRTIRAKGITKPSTYGDALSFSQSDIELTEGDGYQVWITGSPACEYGNGDAGTYPITIGTLAITSEHRDSVNFEYTNGSLTINPKEINGINWSGGQFTYNGTKQVPTATVNTGDDECTVDVSVDGDAINAGTYTATATGLSNPNYTLGTNANNKTKSFTIKKLNVTNYTKEVVCSPSSKKYTGQGLAPDSVSVKLTWKGETINLQDSEYTIAFSADSNGTAPLTHPVAVGSYYAVITLNSRGNYTDNSSPIVTADPVFTIEPGNNTEIYVALTGWTYGDTPNKPKLEGDNAPDISTCKVEYKKASEADDKYNTAKPKKTTEAGEYVVRVSLPNYSVSSYPTQNFTISPAKLTVEVKAKTKEYGKADDDAWYNAEETNITVTGLKNADTLTSVFSGTLERVPGEDAGTYSIRQGSLNTNSNYEIGTFTEGTLTITKKPVTLAWTPDPAVFEYDGQEKAPSAVLNGVKDGDDCDVVVTGGAKDAGDHTASAALTGSKSGNYDLATATDLSYTINALNTDEWNLEVTCSPAEKTYTGMDIAPDSIEVRLTKAGKDDYVLSKTEYSVSYINIDDNNTETDKPVKPGHYKVKVTFLGSNFNGNTRGGHSVTTNNYVFTVTRNPGNLYVSLDGWTYGDVQKAPVLTGADVSEVDTTKTSYYYKKTEEDPSHYTVYKRNQTILGAGTYNIRADVVWTDGTHVQAGSEPVNTFYVSPASVTVKLGSWEKAYGENDKAFSFTASGLVHGDTKSNTFQGSPKREDSENETVGKYAITKGTLKLRDSKAGNYDVDYVDGTATITAKEVHLKWDKLTLTYNGKKQKPVATVTPTDLVQGDTCKVTVSGAQSAIGTHTAVATKLSNSNYKLPSNPTQDFKIVPIDLTGYTLEVECDPEENVYTGKANPPSSVTVKYTKSGSSITIDPADYSVEFVDSKSVEGTPVEAGAYKAKVTLSDIYGNQSDTTASAVYTITPGEIADLEIEMSGWIYGDTAVAPKITGSNAGLVDQDNTEYEYKKQNDYDYKYSPATPTNAGDYTVRVKKVAWNGGADNYTAKDIQPVDFTIETAKVTVTAGSASKTYGDTDPAFDFTAEGLKGSDKKEDVFTGTLSRKAGEDVGSYSIRQGSLAVSTGNYEIEKFVKGTLTINPKTVTLNWENTKLTYNGSEQAPTAVVTPSDLVGSDECEVTVTGAKTNVGTYTAKAAELSNKNYKLPAAATTTFKIKAMNLTGYDLVVECEPSENPYTGQVNPPTSLTAKFTKSGSDDIVPDSSEYTIALTASPVEAGSYDAKVTLNSNYTNYADTAAAVYTITPITSELAIGMTGWTYGDDAVSPLLIGTDARFVDQEATEYEYKKKTDSDSKYSVATPTNAGDYTVRVKKVAWKNNSTSHTAADIEPVDFTIETAKVTVTAGSASKTYGDTDPAFDFTAEGLKGSDKKEDVFTGTLSRKAGEDAGSYSIRQGSLKTNGNYEIEKFVKGTLTINPKTVTLNWENTKLTYNGSEQAPVAVVTPSDLVDSDECEVTVTGAKTNVGTYTAKAAELSNKNYKLPAAATQSFSILPLNLSDCTLEVVCTPSENVYTGKDNPPKSWTVTISKPGIDEIVLKDSDYTIEFRKESGGFRLMRTITGTVPKDAGNYTATITAAPNSNYDGTVTTNTVYTITPTQTDLTIVTTGWTYGEAGEKPVLTGDAANFVDQDNTVYEYKKKTDGDNKYSVATPTNAGDYTVRVKDVAWTGSNSNYTVNDITPVDFTISKAQLKITANDKSKVYGDAEAALDYTVSGLVNQDTEDKVLTGALRRSAGEDVGTYKIKQGTLDVKNDNYEIGSFTQGVYTITPASLTVLPDQDQKKVYGEADPKFTYTLNGLKNGDDASKAITGGKLGRRQGESVNTYAFTLGTLKSDNYTLVLDASAPAFKITKKTAKLAWADTELTYNGQPQAPTASVSNLEDGDSVSVTVSGEQTDAGTYVASATDLTGADSRNYRLPDKQTQKFIIRPLDEADAGNSVEVAISPSESVYDGTKKTISYAVRFTNDGETTTLVPGTDFDAELDPGSADAPTDAGVYTLKITLKGNYKGKAQGTYEILKANQTVTADIKDWTYGDAPEVATITNITPDADHGSVTFEYKPVDADDSEYSDKIPVNAGRYMMRAVVAGTKNYKRAVSKPVSFLISRADLTVIPDDVSKNYGEADPELTYKIASATDLKYGDKASDVLTGALSRAAGENVGEYPITQGTLEANGNYRLKVEDGKKLTITKGTILIAVENYEKTYGEADPEFKFVYVDGLRNGDTTNVITGSLVRHDPTNNTVGSYEIEASQLSAGSNYTIQMQTRPTLTIKPKIVWVVPGSNSSFYGQAVKTGKDLVRTVVGMEYNEDPDSLDYVLTALATRTDMPGEYDYNLTPLQSANNTNYDIRLDKTPKYVITNTDASVDVANYLAVYDGQPHSITVSVKDKDGKDLAGEDSASLMPGIGHSRAAVVYYSSTELDENNYKTEGSIQPVKFTDVTDGPQTVYYFVEFHPGVSSYNYKGEGTVNILPRVIKVTADSGQTKVYGDKDPDELTYTVSPIATGTDFVGNDTQGTVLTGALKRVAGEDVGAYQIQVGTLSAGKNYAIDYTPADFTITAADLTVTAQDASKEYGDADPALEYTVEGLKGTDTKDAVMGGALIRKVGEDVGTYDIEQGTLNAGGNYTITSFKNATFTISEATLTVTADDKAKAFHEADPELTYTVSGLKKGDLAVDVLTGAIERKAGENVGTYPIKKGTLGVSGNNYKINFVDGTFTIGKGSIVVYADAIEKTYGDKDPDLTWTAEYADGATPTDLKLQGKPARAEGENVGEYEITQGNLYDPSGSCDITFIGNKFTIKPATIFATATNLSKEYGDPDPELTYTATGFVNGDKQSDVMTGALTRQAGEKAGDYPIYQGTLDAGNNYRISFTEGKLTIGKTKLYISPVGAEKVYGEADPAEVYDYHVIVNGLQVDALKSIITGSLERAAGEDVGKYAIGLGTLQAGDNFDVVLQTTAYLTITKKDITVVPGQNSSFYTGDIKDPLDYTVEGMANNEDPSSLGITLTTVATNTSQPGSYDYRLTVAQPGNYSVTLDETPKYVITDTDASVDVANYLDVYDGKPHSITVSVKDKDGKDLAGEDSSALMPGTGHSRAAVVYYSSTELDENNYKTEGSIQPVKFTDVTDGPQTVYYFVEFHPGVSSYNYKGEGTVNILPRVIRVTADSGQTKVYGDKDPDELTYTVSPIAAGTDFVGNDTQGTVLTGKLERAAGEDVGSYRINKGTLSAGKNYAIDFVPDDFTITEADLTITANAISKEYGDPDPALTYTVQGLRNGDTEDAVLDGALTREAGEDVNTYDILNGTLNAGGNYKVTFAGAKFNITPATLTVTADDKSKAYNEDVPELTYTVTGLKNGDLAGEVLTGTLDTTAMKSSNVGTYPIKKGTLEVNNNAVSKKNYKLDFKEGTLTVASAVINVYADAKQSKIYGQDDPALTYVAELPDGTAYTGLSGALTRAAGEKVGEYEIQLGTLRDAAGNYAINYVGDVFTINPKELFATAADLSKAYGEADPELIYTVSGLVLGDKESDVLEGELTRDPGETVDGSPYAIRQGTLDVKAGSNYRLTFTPGELTIGAVDVYISPKDAEKTYGEADPAFDYDVYVDGTANNDLKSVISGSLTREKAGDADGENVGKYKILPGSLTIAAKNYVLKGLKTDAYLTIKPVEVTVVPGRNSSFFHQEIKNPLDFTVEGMVNNEDWNEVLNFDLTTVATKNDLPGLYDYRLKVTNAAGSDKNKNYTITLDEAPKYEITTTDASVDAANYYDFYDGKPHSITVAVKDRDGNDLTGMDVDPSTISVPGVGHSKAAVVYYSTEELDETNYNTAGKPLNIEFTDVTDGPQYVYYYVKFHEGVSSKDYKGVATVTILPRVIKIKADEGQSKVYGKKDPDRFKYTIATDTNFVGSDSAGSVLSGKLARVEGEDVGFYEIHIGTLTATKNYAISYTPAEFEITPATIHVTVDEKTKGYGSPDPELTYTVRKSDLKNGDKEEDVMDGYLVRDPGEDVGDYDIKIGSLNAGSNYVIAVDANGDPDINGKGKFHITIATLKVIADDKTRSFGKPNPRLTYKVEGLVAGDLADEVLEGELECTADQTSPVGEYPIGQGTIKLNTQHPSVQAGNYNYKIDFVEGTLKVTEGDIYVYANEIEKVYGQDDPELTYEAVYFDGTAVDKSALRGKLKREEGENVGEYVIKQGTLGDATGNYNITFVSNTFTIKPAALTVTADNIDKEYGEEDPELTYQVDGLQFADTEDTVLAGSLSRQKGEKQGQYRINRGSLHVTTDNYKLVFIEGTFTIGLKDLYIVVDNLEKIYGEPDPEFTFHSVDGDLVPGDLETVIKNALIRDAGENVGKYEIKVDKLKAPNYNIHAQAPGYLTILKRDVTVVPGRNESIYGQDIKDPLSYTVENMAFNEDWLNVLNFSLTTVATKTDLPGEYEYQLKVTNDPSDTSKNWNYTISLDPEPRYYIVDRDASVNVENVTTYYDGEPHSIKAEVFDADGNDLTKYEKGKSRRATVYYSLTPLDDSNYMDGEPELQFVDATDGRVKVYYYVQFRGNSGSGTYDPVKGYAYMNVKPRIVEITADPDQEKTYGDKDPEFTWQITSAPADDTNGTGFIGDDENYITGSLTREPGEDVGTYNILIGDLAPKKNEQGEDQYQKAESNYKFIFKSDTFEIKKADLHVKADDMSKVYGDKDPEFTYKVDPNDLRNGDTVESVLGGTLVRESGEDVNDTGYLIYMGDLYANGNYDIIFTEGIFTILPAELSVTADDQIISFGEADPYFSYTVNGLKNNDSAEDVLEGSLIHKGYHNLGGHVDGEGVGEYVITKGDDFKVKKNSAGKENYTIKFTDGTLYVEPAVLTVSDIKALDKVYDGTTTAEFDTSNITVEGLVGTHTDLVVKASGYFSDKNVGWNKTVIINGLTLEGPDRKNYTLAATGNQVTAKATIYARVIAVTRDVTAEDKTYDGTTDAVLDASNAKLELRNQEKCYNSVWEDKVGENGKTVNEILLEGDDIKLLARGHFEDKTAVEVVAGRDTRKKVFIDEFFFEGEDQINYKLFDDSVVTDTDMNQRTSVNQKFAFAKIFKREVTVPYGIYAVDRIYDGTTDAKALIRNELATIANKVVEDEVFVDVDALFETPDVGKDKTITFEHMHLYGADSENYVLATSGNQLTTTADITPREVVITADDKTDEYLAKILPLTFKASKVDGVSESGLVNEKDAKDLKIVLSTNAKKDSSAGTYTIFVAQGEDPTPNYTVYFRNGRYTITQADAVVIANDYDSVYDGKSHGIEVYVRDTRMDDNLDLPGRKFTDQKEFTKNEANIYYSTTTPLTKDNYEQMGTKEEPVFKDVTDKPVTVYYYVELRDNYLDKYPDSLAGKRTVNITPADLFVAADAKTKVYGDPDPELTYKATGFVAGETAKTVMTGQLKRDKGENVGVYTIRQGTLSAGKNYKITYRSAKLTITKRKVTVKADDKQSKYNQAIKKLTWSLTQGRIIGKDKLHVILKTTAKKGSDVGKYPITGTCEEKNYTVTVKKGIYKIVKADQKAPAAPVIKKVTTTTIVVKARKGEEYSINKGKTWKKPAKGKTTVTFTGLNPDKKYTVYARKQGSKNYNPSPKSKGTNVRTEEDGLNQFGGLIITMPNDNMNIKWDPIKGADGYLVFAAYCGDDFPLVPTKVVKGKKNTNITLTTLNGKKLDQRQDFKVYLQAYKMKNGVRYILCTSIDAHVGGNQRTSVSNAIAVNATPSTAAMAKGMQVQITAEVVLQYANRKQLSNLHCSEFRYKSTNTKVATVSNTGLITARGKGSCIVYVFARNARVKAIKVFVE